MGDSQLFMRYLFYYIFLLIFFLRSLVSAQDLDDFRYNGEDIYLKKRVTNEYQFNGYTNYWHNTYRKWVRNGNLYKISIDDVEKTILQSKVDIAEDMGLPGLIMQEGFFSNLTSASYQVLDQPIESEFINALEKGNVLVYVDPESSIGKDLTGNLIKRETWLKEIKSYQYNAMKLIRIDAFYLQKDGRKIFVVSSGKANARNKFRQQIINTENIIRKYDFYKGWFGAETLLKSVTITKGHPLEVIGTGMNEGNSWFVFSGYMDVLAKEELNSWMDQVNLPIVTDVGFSPIFGCKDYDDFQDRLMYTKESWVNYAERKEGYVFRNVWDKKADPYHYNGYFATEGNKEQIDNENVPFVLKTGKLEGNTLSSMVLFIEKEKQLTRESMWDAILQRREVGILEKGKMMGPELYRNALQLLLLDRIFLEEYFGDRIDLETKVQDYRLEVKVTNTYSYPVSGNLELTLPKDIGVNENSSVSIHLDPGSSRIHYFNLKPGSNAMDNTNPIAVHYIWNGRKKSTVTMLDLPPVISVHRLLYGHTPKVSYPVTIHNFKETASFPVKVEVLDLLNGEKVILNKVQNCNISISTFQDLLFDLEIPSGDYKVKVSALGTENISQLGVGKAEGASSARTIDLNDDGVEEYQMQNDSVKITLLAKGARVIEYEVKSRDDNVLFKLWPEKVIDHKRPFRERGFYPYGGFEDFLGQGSMENHRIYNAEILKSEGDFVRVRMWTDYFGNRLEKTYTLYGNSPLLEVRFALTFKNPEANVLGPQPILELGEKHGTEEVFTIPEMDGLHEYRMRPEKRYGMIFHIKEGWNAAYDTKEDLNFIGAYPVDQPLFLHMFLNDPGNKDSHYHYAEFQPWVPIFQKSTMYFTYYMWGAGGFWKNSVEALRSRNLITIKNQRTK